ncbi:hypothetical protein I7I53_09242 [Histoplasma capsulatum var. duboisii H88]|uniref:Uncharacterized protein n=1 Tax=Ajellomyces capsulatus (strain H88) TaxID=544711 RepID=A0A8A1L8A3_AJEC8|nr:hypothetical protein I7I53_09242 [Histoplasma capsulatum var. duboisii H88]
MYCTCTLHSRLSICYLLILSSSSLCRFLTPRASAARVFHHAWLHTSICPLSGSSHLLVYVYAYRSIYIYIYINRQIAQFGPSIRSTLHRMTQRTGINHLYNCANTRCWTFFRDPWSIFNATINKTTAV